MRVCVEFKENGDEYRGYFNAVGVHGVSFNPEFPKCVYINGARIEMDEDITAIAVGVIGKDMPLDEPWERHDPSGS